ncbi:RNA polymerase sigma factor [Algoriphagus machipongonensis]|uniref:DNA-directed RNA polymerase sigma24 subunit n=1 Tax=Algoriphagus machipongonensis TaxID=388413 RepID=A3I036_9BACT|nr:RNA polymerase sigma factor [Algoriphagus machipongonensis]EAZ79832.1 DNA-directed RNA polymerase sigma24 subunit [Algoriphagus machipongonensis]
MISDKLETKIWQGLVDKNRKDQEVLYKKYYSYGMSVCLRYTNTREVAKEILHDGFMILFSNPKKYDPNMAFKPWFRRILVNLCINNFKKHQKKALENSIDTIQESTDSYPNALETMQYEELLSLILRLPPAYRAVFNLYILDGFSHEEIAGMLEISIGTSKSNLSRAREKLKEMLNPKSYERETLRQER